MTAEFNIYDLGAGAGTLAICPLPRSASDLDTLRHWSPDLILSLTTTEEMARLGATTLRTDLSAMGADLVTFEIPDFGVPSLDQRAQWSVISIRIRMVLSQGGRVAIHCRGGCGRSGMVALRLMIELGEEADAALIRLRMVRPCAVETDAQRLWAFAGGATR